MTIPTVKDTFQKKTSSAPLVCPNLKQKDLSSYSCTYMQRRKHVQLDLRVSLFRAEPGTTVKKGIDTERKEQQYQLPEAWEQWRKKVQRQCFSFLSFRILFLDFLFPDSPKDYFSMKKKTMQKNFTINNFGIKKKPIVSERILKAFRDARNRMQRGVFYHKAQKNKTKKIQPPNKTKQAHTSSGWNKQTTPTLKLLCGAR